MKKNILVTVLILLFSCSNSDNNEVDNDSNSIVGTWTWVKENVEGKWEIPWDSENTCGNLNRIVFSIDGSFNNKYYTIRSAEGCELEYDNYGYWELNNDIITILLTEDKVDGDIASGFIDDYKIIELTSDKLIIGNYFQGELIDEFYEFKKVN